MDDNPNIAFDMSMSNDIGKLIEALAKAQTKFGKIHKNQSNPYFKSKYADLTEVIDKTLPALNAQGLTLIQYPNHGYLFSLLAHSSGQWIKGSMRLPEGVKAQAIGSDITYYKRYMWCGLCGVSADDDDDGNAASQVSKPVHQSNPKTVVKQTKPKPAALGPKDVLEAMGKKQVPITLGKDIVKLVTQKQRSSDLTQPEFKKVIKYIESSTLDQITTEIQGDVDLKKLPNAAENIGRTQ